MTQALAKDGIREVRPRFILGGDSIELGGRRVPKSAQLGKTNHIPWERLWPARSSATAASKTGSCAVRKRVRSDGSSAAMLTPRHERSRPGRDRLGAALINPVAYLAETLDAIINGLPQRLPRRRQITRFRKLEDEYVVTRFVNRVGWPVAGVRHRRALRQPAALADSSEQNQRSP